jgi:hypothetical protein
MFGYLTEDMWARENNSLKANNLRLLGIESTLEKLS